MLIVLKDTLFTVCQKLPLLFLLVGLQVACLGSVPTIINPFLVKVDVPLAVVKERVTSYLPELVKVNVGVCLVEVSVVLPETIDQL